ncbi:MAG TPA: hypothetical protein VLJ76_03850 [Gaiellaceae bacterium]|nr:hypothetical protein [Gaiellaceae bacterium]
MRVALGAAALIVVVVGGFWLVLSQLVSGSFASEATNAYEKSVRCIRADPALTLDQADATKIAGGRRAIGIRWKNARAVAIFAATPQDTGTVVERLAGRLQAENTTIPEIDLRLRRRGYAVLDYVSGRPGAAGIAALGRCIYVVRPNRIARFFGLNITHLARPFLGTDDRRPAVRAVTSAEVVAAFSAQQLSLTPGLVLEHVPNGSLSLQLNAAHSRSSALELIHLAHFANVWVEYRLSGALLQRADSALATLRRDAFD